MLAVAAIGLAVNVAGVLMLRAGSAESLNVKSECDDWHECESHL